jgi:tetratricopeptide (TPR) repeat protein
LYLADLYILLGDVQWTRPEESAAAFRQAKEIYDKHAAQIAADATPQDALGISSHYLRLAYFLACAHREDEAAEFLRQAAVYAQRLTDPAGSISGLSTGALLQLRLGDFAGYRDSCKALADVPVADADDLTKVRWINTWCCGPDALEDMSIVVTLAEQLVASNSHGQRHVILYVSGAALYRAGEYDRAAERLEESIAAYPSDPPPAHAVINFQRLFLAMTKWKQGKRDEARRLLAETLPALDMELKSSSWWNYRLGLEVLRDEAEALIEPKETDEARENVPLNPEP